MYSESGIIDFDIVLVGITYFLLLLCMLWNQSIVLTSEEKICCDTNLKNYFEKKNKTKMNNLLCTTLKSAINKMYIHIQLPPLYTEIALRVFGIG